MRSVECDNEMLINVESLFGGCEPQVTAISVVLQSTPEDDFGVMTRNIYVYMNVESILRLGSWFKSRWEAFQRRGIEHKAVNKAERYMQIVNRTM
jgi:hypothetical protein